MFNSSIRFAVLVAFALLWNVALPSVAQAQNTDTGNNNNDAGADAGAGAAGGIGTLDADTAFSAVERGDTIGATGDTGASFSAASTTNGGGAGGGGGGGIGGFGGLGGLGGFGNLFGNQNTNSQSSTPTIRTRLRSAVKVPPMAPTQIQRAATQRFRTLPSNSRMRGVNVSMQQGGTAVISGVVSSPRDRRMSELLMRLEPGVRSVENRVIVQP